MKKITILLNVLFFIAIKCNAGSFIDGYRSIGYWIGGGASLVAEEGAYERHNSMGDVYYSFNQRIFNYMLTPEGISYVRGDLMSVYDYFGFYFMVWYTSERL